MSDDNVEVDTQVVEQLAAVADVMAGLLQKVSEKHENQSKDMDHFREDLSEVRDSIRHIARVLHEGNGEKPLISRVAVLEEKCEHIEESLDKIELRQEGNRKTAEQRKNIDKKGKYAIGAAIFSGLGLWGVEIIRWISSN